MEENPQVQPRGARSTDPRWRLNHLEHDKPFKPSHPPRQVTTEKTIGKFPSWKGEPPKEITRKAPEDPDAPKKFKPTHNNKTAPCPSVATNFRNLKSSFPTVFRR